MARANAFWPTAVVGEADNVNSVSASACHIGGPKEVSPGQKALLHGSRNIQKGVLDSSSRFFVRSAPIGDVFSDPPVDRHGPVSLVAAVSVFCRHQGKGGQ